MTTHPLIFNINWNACLKCGACIAVCPLEADFVSPFDSIAENKPCVVACQNCIHVCPVSAINFRLVNETDLPVDK